MEPKPDYTRLSVEVFNDGANLYQKKYGDVSLYSQPLKVFASLLSSGNSVLDIACGPGNLSRFLMDNVPDLRITGIDLAEGMLTIAREVCSPGEFKKLDARDITTLGQSFHGIVCGFGLPYLSKEEAITLIENASQMLTEGGVLYLSTMEDRYEKSSIQTSSSTGQSLFMHFHEEEYLVKALKNNFLDILHQEKISNQSSSGPTCDLVLVAHKPTKA